MKLNPYLQSTVAGLFLAGSVSALTIPSDGSDGVFNPTSDIVVDLSLAPTGAWDANNAANAGKGLYDSGKWAVVFKYASVNIPEGVTVTFKNHPAHAPVVWLVSGNVVIDGTVSVAGKTFVDDAISKLTPTEAGPGGFRGGAMGPAGSGAGYGPGGSVTTGAPGTYGASYGNPQIVPLIGGSGAGSGSGFGGFPFYSSGGGGALLLAAASSVSVSGLIDANGGGSASGGAVRIIAEQVAGSGQIRALSTVTTSGNSGTGGTGRIRIEATSLASTVQISPQTIAVPPAAVPIIWPADDAPVVRVASVDGVAAPADPTAPLVSSADLNIQQNGTVQVVLEARNFPVSGNVQLRTVQKYGPAAWVTATYQAGDFAQSTWIANVTFAPGFTTLQARATVP